VNQWSFASDETALLLFVRRFESPWKSLILMCVLNELHQHNDPWITETVFYIWRTEFPGVFPHKHRCSRETYPLSQSEHGLRVTRKLLMSTAVVRGPLGTIAWVIS
jgi:hypothetical protein